MTVFEYFDYEKQLMEDLKAVKTQRAKDAIYDSILRVLDDHKMFVTNTMREFEARAQDNAKHIAQAYKGETPDYVKKLMAEFGFYELEEADDFCLSSVPSHMKKDISHKLKSLCKTESPAVVDNKKSNGLSDEEADAQNIRILANAGLDDKNINYILTPSSNDGVSEASEKTASKAKVEIEEFLNAKPKKTKSGSQKRATTHKKAAKTK